MPNSLKSLLPCPFCGSGGDMLIIEHCEGTDIHPAYRVTCDNCGASSRYTDKDIAEPWNTRAPIAEGGGLAVCAEHGIDQSPGCQHCESLSRQGATRASEAGDCPDGFVLVRKEAIDWLNGESDFECPPDRYFRGQPPRYWWRSVFREKAGLAIAAAPAPGGGPVNSNNQTRISDEN